MELLEFLRLKPTLDTQFNKIGGCKIVQKLNSIEIEIDQNVGIETVQLLLHFTIVFIRLLATQVHILTIPKSKTTMLTLGV
jgi:hypothetical protein